jgi:hypothetical protein
MMHKQRRSNAKLLRFVSIGLLLLFTTGYVLQAASAQHSKDKLYYLPAIATRYDPSGEVRTINIPYLGEADIVGKRFTEMAIFWFGSFRYDRNYVDTRVAYNNTELVVHATIFDRRLWYNTASTGADLTNWDSVTLTLHTDDATAGSQPDGKSYQFTGQLLWWESDSLNKYTAAYQGNGTSWLAKSIPFTTKPAWRGNAPNDDINDHGWTIVFSIPFSSLGLSGPPAAGKVWRLGMIVHDRDQKSGAMIAPQYWPETFSIYQPASWGRLRFGQPGYTAPPASNIQKTTIRHKLNGAVVPDAAVGGGMMCGGGLDPWAGWGNANYAGKEQLNIQNQQDVSDFPCFSKYYVTFPLSAIPPGKVIRSAVLSLYQYGGSDPANAYSSIIQVSMVREGWNEATITWSNAPMALENVSQAVVPVFAGPIVWPGVERKWDVSRAAAKAYRWGDSLRLVFYSADAPMHSGKYFSSSDTGDWNQNGRPTLVVEWGDP